MAKTFEAQSKQLALMESKALWDKSLAAAKFIVAGMDTKNELS